MKLSWTIHLLFWALVSAAGQQQDSLPFEEIQEELARLEILRHEQSVDSVLTRSIALSAYYREHGSQEEYLKSVIYRAELLRSINSLQEGLMTLEGIEEEVKGLPPSEVLGHYFNRKAAILFELKRKAEAAVLAQRSIDIDLSLDTNFRLYSNWNILGAIYRDAGDFEAAEKILLKSYQRASQHKEDKEEMLSALFNLTHNSFRSKAFEKAVSYGKEYLSSNRGGPVTYQNGEMQHLVARSYDSLGNVEMAHRYLDSAHAQRLKDMEAMVAIGVENTTIISKLENERLKNSILQVQREEDRLQKLILFISIFLVFTLGLVFYVNQLRLKAVNREQEKENEILAKDLTFKDTLMSIVAHDIRSPMGSLRGMIDLYEQEAISAAEFKVWMKNLSGTLQDVDLLLENLLNWVRSQNGEIRAHIEEYPLRELIQSVLTSVSAQLKEKNIKLNLQVEGDPKVRVDPNILTFALRNILSNAAKFSEDKGEIKLRVPQADGRLILVQDQGRGMNADQLEKVNAQESFSVRGTRSEKGTGMGLALSRKFLAAMGAKLQIESELGEGTTVSIHLA